MTPALAKLLATCRDGRREGGMEKLKAWIGLKIVCFGIFVMEIEPYGLLDTEDKLNLTKLWDLYDEFSAILAAP